jgi:alpha-D-ribose 1-methylphosphonate 5-triphosphate diphosphatase PhnM
VNGIANVMVENGLEVAVVDRIKVRPSMLSQMNELHLLSLMDVRPGTSKAIDEYREKYMDTLIEEYRNGVSTIDGFICVVGKKPADGST